jgi:putative transposase
MPSHLKRYNTFGHDHFITFSCYHRLPYLNDDHARTVFLDTLERTRQKHQFHVFGYVLMPEHVHLLRMPHISLRRCGFAGCPQP